jgi:hypothetical protein
LLATFYDELHERRGTIKESIRSGEGDRVKLEEALTVIEEVLEIKGSLASWQDEVERALGEGALPDWAQGLDE